MQKKRIWELDAFRGLCVLGMVVVHLNTFKTLEEQLLKGELTEKEEPILWRCLNCGYTYESIRTCDPCPVCGNRNFLPL